MFRATSLTVFTFLAILMFAASGSAQLTMHGEVVDVIDGKTVLVAIPGARVKVELQYIDVPEPGQHLYDTVKQHLRQLVVGKSVEYRPKTLLRDRAIGRLMIKNIDISQQMLRDGAAWHKPIDSSGQEKAEYDIYAATEAAAKQEKVGVWVPGLRQAWERRAEKKINAWQKEQYSFGAGRYTEAVPNRRSGMPIGANPSLGNVGALANGYDPISGTGFLGTSFLGVAEVDKASPNKTIIDISYYYKQDANNRRKGDFVVSVISFSKKWRFLERNNLVIKGSSGKDIIIGKAKRTATNYEGDYSEKLVYAVSRSALERIVNDSEVVVKINDLSATPSPTIRYLLYNLLQVTE